jgi:hypothetical protein
LERFAWVLLPSFLFAAAVDIVFFGIFDPVHSPFVMDPLGMTRVVAFAEVLLSLWILAAAAIALTLLARRRRSMDAARLAREVNGHGA